MYLYKTEISSMSRTRRIKFRAMPSTTLPKDIVSLAAVSVVA